MSTAPSGGVAPRLLMSLAGVLVALLAAEVGIRVYDAVAARGTLRALHRVRPDRPWLYDLEPGARARLAETGAVTYAVSEDGLRDRRYTPEKPPGATRVVVLGDSLTFGYGVEEPDVYPSVMEERLAQQGVGPVEILNLGVGGYNPYNEAALFEGVGRAYHPDLVVAQLCINDLNDPALHFDANTRLALGRLPAEAFPGGVAPQAPSLCDRSRLCARLLAALSPPDTEALRAAFEARVGPEHTPAWRWLGDRYAEIASAAAADRARFAVLVFPYRDQVEGDADAAFQQRARALGERRGWHVIDLLPAFRRAAAEGGEPLFLDAWHPTARGHRVAAAEALRSLACLGLLPAPDDLRCAGPASP